MRELELIITDDEVMTALLIQRVNAVRLKDLVESSPKGNA